MSEQALNITKCSECGCTKMAEDRVDFLQTRLRKSEEELVKVRKKWDVTLDACQQAEAQNVALRAALETASRSSHIEAEHESEWDDCDNAVCRSERRAALSSGTDILALLREAGELLKKRCEDHHLPLERDPQGDAHYPLSGWYHPTQMQPDHHNKTGIVYSMCHLTDEERELWPRIHDAMGEK